MKAWITQIQTMWSGWTTAQKLSIAGAAVLCVVAVVGVGAWSMQSQYVPVASDLSPATAAEIVSALEAAGIETQLNFSGSAVLVPKQDLSRARLASGKLLDVNSSSQEDLESSVWADPSLNHVRLLRQQEQRLARSIERFEFVRTATVHISKPEPSPFLRDRQSPTASVVIELKGTNAIARQDAAAIVSLVAHAVEGLNPDQVTVMDTQGHLLSVREPVDGDVAGQLEYRHRLEADLAIKAETLLAQMLGAGKAVVRVTADLDFNERQTERKTYDPDGKVKVTETIESESGPTTSSRTTSGSPGTGANAGNAAAAAASGASGSGGKSERSETTYANAETLEKNREAPGRLVRLTVAAVVQLTDPTTDAKTNAAAAPAVDVKQVEQLIRQAVGFDESRSDQISVVTATLAGAIPEVPAAAGVPWDKYEQLARSASLGLAAIVAFLLGMLTLRRLRPTITVAPEGAAGEADQRLASLSLRARENPEAVAQALNAWLATRSAESPPTIPIRKAG